jgi:hypothetical protein
LSQLGSPISTRGWKGPGVFIALGLVTFILGSFYPAPSTTASSPHNTCIGIGGWPCGYSGSFTGNYYAGYATLGCTPISPNNPCVVPQIAMPSSFLVIQDEPYVIRWANQTFQSNNQLTDGTTISITGDLAPVVYNKTAGSTYPIYASNSMGLWNPQPQLQIQNATLTTGTISSCTTTLTYTVSGTPNGVWNLPMIPTGACYTVRNAEQQPYAFGNVAIQIPAILLASLVGGVGLIVIGIVTFMKKPTKQGKR